MHVQAKETAKDVDQSLGLTQRIRAFIKDWPIHSANLRVFLRTPRGRFVTFAFSVFLFYTGLWRPVLQLFLWLTIFGPFIVAPFLVYEARKRVVEEIKAAEEAERRRRDPVYAWKQAAKEAWQEFQTQTQDVSRTNPRQRGDSTASSRTTTNGRRRNDDDDGPIVEAEVLPSSS